MYLVFAIIMLYISAFIFVVSSIISVFFTNKRLVRFSIKSLLGSLAIAAFSIILIANMSEANENSIKAKESELSQLKLEYTKLLEDYQKLEIEYKELEDTHAECDNKIKQKDKEIKQRDDRIKQFEKEWIEMNNTIKKLKEK